MDKHDLTGWVILAILCVLMPALIPIGVVAILLVVLNAGFKNDGKPRDTNEE